MPIVHLKGRDLYCTATMALDLKVMRLKAALDGVEFDEEAWLSRWGKSAQDHNATRRRLEAIEKLLCVWHSSQVTGRCHEREHQHYRSARRLMDKLEAKIAELEDRAEKAEARCKDLEQALTSFMWWSGRMAAGICTLEEVRKKVIELRDGLRKAGYEYEEYC